MASRIDRRVPSDIEAVLGRLRRRIRQYVFLEGTALVVVLLAVLFWFSLGLEWSYFQMRNLELPIWVRKTFGILTLCLFVAGLTGWIVLRILRGLRTRALALVLERRFPELDDRLMTAVELAESTSGRESELTSAMLERTVADASRVTADLPVGAVFEKRPLVRAVTLAAVLVASIGGFWAANASAMDHWADAYLRGWFGEWKEDYRPRDTRLIVKVIAQPNDRIRDFRDAAGQPTQGLPGSYRHPSGGDLTLMVEVPEGMVVPERIQLDYTLDGGRGSARAVFTSVGERQFRHTVGGLLDSLRFWIKGGDYANRQPYRIEVVDPPRIDALALDCLFPAYAGLNSFDKDGKTRLREERKVAGTQIAVPMGTDFVLRATANKSLVGLLLQTDAFELAVDRESARLTLPAGDGGVPRVVRIPPSLIPPFPTTGGSELRIPFLLDDDAPARLLALSGTLAGPIPLAPDSLLRIYLDDVDEISSLDPVRLTVGGVVDLPPEVVTELKGIGTAITRKAMIPVSGLITDDYGVAKARFEFKVDAGEDWRPRPFQRPPKLDAKPHQRPREYKLQESPERQVERYEVLPLDLAEGQKLTLTVFAEDGDDLHGPHSSRGERYEFRIVSNEELLSILYARELNLRRRFEQIISEVEATRNDLIKQQTLLVEARALRAKTVPADGEAARREELQRIRLGMAASSERGLHQVRKNANETVAIEISFGEILEELVNNAVHTQQMVERIDALIVKPLHAIVADDFPAADQAVNLFRLDHEKELDPEPRIEQSVQALGTMLAHMRAVLKEMQDLADFHEAIADLKLIIDEELRLQQETENERKRQLLEKLKGLQD